jgi:predicted O-methyltransferase YrrM
MEHFYDRLSGWFDYQGIYSRMVECANDRSTFVEVGSYMGRSAAFMAVEIINSGKRITLHCVDPKQDFVRNLSEVSHVIRPIGMASPAASEMFDDSSVDFVWIDGDHSDEAVLADIAGWLPKVRKGGWIGGHDHDHPAHPGVRAACERLLPGYEIVRPSVEYPGVDSWLWQKP